MVSSEYRDIRARIYSPGFGADASMRLIVAGAFVCGSLIFSQLVRDVRVFPRTRILDYPGMNLPWDASSWPALYIRPQPVPSPDPDPDPEETLPPPIPTRKTPEPPRNVDLIYRGAGNTATIRNVALYRGQDWLSGLSFAKSPLAGVKNIVYSSSKLRSTGFVVLYDGSEIDDHGNRNPEWHVTVYYPIKRVWDDWYTWERRRENLGKPNNSLMDYHSMTYLLWGLREGIIN